VGFSAGQATGTGQGSGGQGQEGSPPSTSATHAGKAVYTAGNRLDRPSPGFFGELRYWLYYVSWVVARSVFYVLFGLRLEGKKHVPKSGGFIVASNHQSLLDPIIVGIAVGPRRQLHYMARKTLFFPPLSWLIRLYNAFPIERGGADFEALEAAEARVRAGLPVLVFPEGTRTCDGRLQRVRSGAARLALATGAPVVPCYIHGSFRAWPRGKKFLRPVRGMRVTLGEPIMPEGKADSKRDRDAFTERLQNALAAMEAEAYSNAASLAGGSRSK
jgi:1-acyl-sn-glycerol-3-phosphate acyltransferase